jgi:hypothetical protein
MLVPETAVHKYYGSVFGKNEIRASRQGPFMKSESEASCVKLTSHNHFRRSVFAADPTHIEFALLSSKYVSHAIPAVASCTIAWRQ